MESRRTKKVLFMSLVSLLLCCSMLIGSTFAWFTDSVASGNNTIVAGNLDVELEYATAFDDSGAPTAWDSVENANNLFHPAQTEDTLWEPGHTEVVYLRVRNAGTLALKYNLTAAVYGDPYGAPEKAYTNQAGESFKLSEHLVFNAIPDKVAALAQREDAWLAGGQSAEEAVMGKLNSVTGEDILLKKGEEKVFTLAVYMPTWVGNVANYMTGTDTPEIYISLNLVATQATVENDSFGNTYDENAEYPTVEQTAFADGSASFTFPGETLTGAKATTVTFPAGSFTPGDTLSLVVNSTELDESAAEKYPVIDGFAPIGSVTLTLLVNGEPQTSFNGQSATIATYVAEALDAESIYVRYIDGDQAIEEHFESYEPDTGKLTFTTNHFSEFAVYTNTSAYKYSATLLSGKALNGAIKDAANNTASATNYTVDQTVQSVTFSVFDAGIVGADWEDGTYADADKEGDIRIFVVGGSDVYICVQPGTQIHMNNDSSWMFANMRGLTSINFGGDLVSTSDVTNMYNLFYICEALQAEAFAQAENWDVSNVSDMSGMFRGCDLLTEVDLSNWNTASLKDIRFMFMGDEALVSVDVSGWDTSKITNMSSLFANCKALTTIQGLSGWTAEHVTTMDSMFHTCESLTEIDLSGFRFEDLTSLKSVFTNCYALEKIEGLSNWNTGKVTDMSSLFFNCYALTELDLPNFVRSSVKNLSSMFNSCKALTKLTGTDSWDTSNVTNMNKLFSECEAMPAFDLSGWDVSKVTDMSSLFQGCSSAKEITVTGWTVKAGTKTTYMFVRCGALERIYTDRDWEITGTSSNIFSDCKALTGGYGTSWAKSYESKANYARIDRDGTPGFFTDIKDKP